MDVDEAAQQLYGVSPDVFVAERTALVAQARAEGDKATAEEIRRLAKPSQPAWQVNLLVRHDPAAVDDLATVAAALRTAAETGDALEVRRVDSERRATVARLADRAAELALTAGKPTTATTRGEVEATLQAALRSPDAAAQVASGRLTAGLFDSGLDALGLLSLAPAPLRPAVARGATAGVSRGGRRGTASGPAEAASAAAGSDSTDEAAEALQVAEEALRAADEEAAEARARADQLAEEVTQLTARLQALRRRATTATADADSAADRATAARAAHTQAQRAHDATHPTT